MLRFRTQVAADQEAITLKMQEIEQSRPTPARKARLDRLRLQLATLQSDIHALPDDVLRHIFELGSRGGKDKDYSILVSHVCQRWRRVAIATATLWSDILLELPLPKGRRSASFSSELIRRSAQAPISLTFELPYAGVIPSDNIPSKILHDLLLRCNSYRIIGAGWNLRSNSPPILEWITVGLTSSLRSLALSYIRVGRDGMGGLRNVLERCVSVERLALEHISILDGPETMPETKVICMPNLSYLRLERIHTEDSLLRDLLPYIHGPVTTLVLRDFTVEATVVWCERLRLLFTGSVRSLHFHGRYMSSSTLLRLCTQLPHLEKLTCLSQTWLLSSSTWPPPWPPAVEHEYAAKLKRIELNGVPATETQRILEFLENHGLPRNAMDGKLEIVLDVIWTSAEWNASSSKEERAWLRSNVQTLNCDKTQH
ncbi:hypothetical protein CALVIDRAFT_538159 [Calocera viscosa TUFC12733]|uniref:Uncharacterized protein n=1 Tax=Calocera viscosa (strain TUFC12733) TaxID=1330018 RepID=A0A167L6C9_CALVF|nr:hypothetical protein CALVIDRAFT_538159 [Calocera viscosa TUFC12733]